MPEDNRSVSEIIQDVIANVREIIRAEVRLAKAEVGREVKQTLRSGAMLCAGAVLGLYAAGFFFLGLMHALEIVMPAWLAAFAIALLIGLTAAVLIFTGADKLRQVSLPRRSIGMLKENLQWMKEHPRN